MSEENRVQNAGQEQGNKVESLLKVTQHDSFDGIVEVKYISAKELCETVSSIFKQIFGDFEGCTLDGVPGTNTIEIKLFFNHNDNLNGLPACCTKEIDNAGTTNTLLAQTRRYNARMTYGDRYFVTEEGQATLAPLLINNNSTFKNGAPQWGKICSEVADPAGQNMFNPIKQQYTVISFIDPTKIIELIYGTEATDENGNSLNWVYNIRLVNSAPTIGNRNANTPANWMLAIDRISEEETEKLARRYGINMGNGLNIVR